MHIAENIPISIVAKMPACKATNENTQSTRHGPDQRTTGTNRSRHPNLGREGIKMNIVHARTQTKTRMSSTVRNWFAHAVATRTNTDGTARIQRVCTHNRTHNRIYGRGTKTKTQTQHTRTYRHRHQHVTRIHTHACTRACTRAHAHTHNPMLARTTHSSR